MRRRSSLTPAAACEVLQKTGIPRGTNFYVLSSSKVSELLEFADVYGYRKPKNANGSRGRYFHELLQRRCR